MELALYHPTFGYYTAGTVAFGDDAHFWTFPERLSPTFGRVIARHVVAMRQALIDDGALGVDEVFTVVELGAGEGWLADDILTALAEDFADVLPRVAYRIGDRAPALRERQRARLARWFEAGRVAHLEQGAGDLMPRLEPVVGLVLSNELFDVYPHELIRWDPNDSSLSALRLDAGPDLEARAAARGPDPVIHASFAPTELRSDYLAALTPLTPRELLFAPGMDTFFAWVDAHLLRGFVMTIDYGGSAMHCLDPAPALPQLRVYPEPVAHTQTRTPAFVADLLLPGRQDVTVDIDFSHLAFAGRTHGFEVVHFGPQGDLCARAGIDPLDKGERARVVKRLKARGMGEVVAQTRAYETARGFATGSAGFRVLVQARGATRYTVGVVSDAVLPEDLWLVTGPIPAEHAEHIKATGDVASDLDHAGLRASRHERIAALAAAGVIRRAGRTPGH